MRSSSRSGFLGRVDAVRVALVLLASVFGAACFESNTVECSGGVVCPQGFVCTADGLGCTNTVCGNMIIDEGEECDDGNQSNDDDCLRTCQRATCGDGFVDRQGPDTEDCDDNGADTADCDSDCTFVQCGDDHRNAAAGEICDDGNTDSGDGCKGDCSSSETCGNGITDSHLPNTAENMPVLCLSATATGTNCAEVCDDGNNISGDGCSANCLSEEECRNGILDPGEVCDDGDIIDTNGCRNDCLGGAGCGNGLLDPLTEQCDENGQDTATCDRDCSVPICGDGLVNLNANEECDPRAVGANVADCNADCTVPSCGDGITNRAFTPPGGVGPEQCDDGGNVPGDGCSALCRIETCGNGVTEMINGEACDDGNTDDLDGCRNNCQLPACGDGVVSASEVCDTGGNSATCNFDCTLPSCGDGLINNLFTPAGGAAPEACDDGNNDPGDGCSPLCRIETCGNGITEGLNGEQCDDGDTNDFNGCRNNCQLPACGDGIESDSELCDTGVNAAGCDYDCTAPMCGDGIVNAAADEQCEDGNLVNGDGCSSTCRLEPFTLTAVVAGTGAGTVSSVPTGISCGTDCSELYLSGTMVTLTATPSANSLFTGWTGGGCTGTATCTVTMDEAKTVTATFDLNLLTVTRSGTGGGTVTATGINCGSDCTQDYGVNTMVTLVATPAANSTFTGWSLPSCPGTGSCTVTMNGARTVNAEFTLSTYTLSVTRGGTGTGTVASFPAGVDCGTTCSAGFVAGTEVTLVATPAANATFEGWSGGCTGTGACTVTMNANTPVTATFTLKRYTLDVSRNGTGTVTSSPSGINCGSDCTEDYVAGTLVTLTATPGSDRAFVGWSGACTGTGTCTVTMDAAKAVTATFETNRLTVVRAGDGSGTVTSSPSGINCGNNCTEDYNAGTMVTLTAVAASDARFAGWSGGGCTGTGTCTVTMNGATTITATFLDIQPLTVNRTGGGTGTVTSDPAGINCGGTCTATFDEDTSVTLTATPGAGSRFTGWSGSGCSGTGTCTVVLSAARTVTANFELNTLTVTKSGSGTGTVTSDVAGINCGGDCTQDYDLGTVVVLTATPDAGSLFTGWSGACTGTGTCSVTMSTARSVTATFAPAHTLTVTVIGSGSVASTPVGITCGADCTESYVANTVVTLVPTADEGSTFDGWTGACTGNGACMVTMDAAKAVTATFSTP
ncbi:MAG TPA: DUF4215 domain-containing protein [Kofleriaceae bacterium]|nr:DUF4215 domain-containing protein [Kofleriaceae bacterium]